MKNPVHQKHRSNIDAITRIFLPCHITKKRASLLKKRFFIFYSFLYILFAFSIHTPNPLQDVLGYASSIKVSELHQKTNEYRVANNLPNLRLNPQLSEAAMEKAKYMFDKNFWAHTAPDGTEPWAFLLQEGYDYSYAGENLAKNFFQADDIVKAWIASPTHRENLISKNFDEVGYAVLDGKLDGKETTLVVQFFGRPKDLTLVATPEVEKSLLASYDEAAQNSAESTNESDQIPTLDIPTIFRYLSFTILGFVIALYLADIYYSKKKDINKFTGHTEAHLMLLLATIVSLIVILRNGNIL